MVQSRIESDWVPQADRLEDIVRTVEAVAGGARTFQEIARAIGKVERQGRYYRRAAETMGLIENHQNYSEVTPLGHALAAASGADRQLFLRRAVLKNPVVKRVLAAAADAGSSGLSRDAITGIVASETTATGTTPDRRTSTIRAWLRDAEYLEEVGHRLRGKAIPAEVFVEESVNLGLPVAPLTDLRETSQARQGSQSIATYEVDYVMRERASLAHARLIDRMAESIRDAGGVPRQNMYVDLAAELGGRAYLFEMKSANQTNFHTQVRRGLSQLYEYRYIQRVPDAALCLVIEIPPPTGKAWLSDYLISDRGIHMCWEASQPASPHGFECDPRSEPEIGLLL